VGAGWAGKTIFKALNEHGKSLYLLVGFVDDKQKNLGTVVEMGEEINQELLTHPSCLTVIGRQKHLLRIVKEYNVTTIVLAITEDIPGDLYQILADCLQYGIEIVPMTVLYEDLTGKVPVEHVGDQWSVSMPLEHPGTQLLWSVVKRGFDLVWSSFGMVILVVLFPFVVIAIKLDSKGPVFYHQERVGRHGRKFTVYKFRSMVFQAEKGQEQWAEKNDPRITRVGKLLRLTHLDEFPQFWNILKGEMSVVGPRPERPEFVERLAEEIPFYRVRLAVKPGMAGWALIHQGYGSSIKDTLVKLQYDLYYIKHQSLWLDVFILGRTILDALTFGGR
jgi:exopolysaccharide biosynthesis polyprenyl glycosylphosphotransferase